MASPSSTTRRGPRAPAALMIAALAAVSCNKKPPPGGDTPHPEPRATAAPTTSASAAPPAPTASASAAPSIKNPRTTCPRTLAGKPEAWRARLVSAATESARDAAMAEIDSSWPAPGLDDEGKPAPPWKLDGAALSKAALAGARPDDYWVDIRFSQPVTVEHSRAVRSAALIKQPDGTYCALEGPREEQAAVMRACLGGTDNWPVDFFLFHVVDKDRMTIVASSSSGLCGGCGRAGHADVAFFDVQGFDLVNVFQQETFDAQYQGCPWPPEEWRAASVVWVGPYPRDIVVVDEHACAEPGLLRPGSTNSCKPDANETRYAFRGGKYVSTATRPVTAPYGLHIPITEGGLDDGSGRAWAGRCYKRLQDSKLDEAETDCKRAIDRGTDKEIRASAYYNLALVSEKRGDTKAACEHLKASLAIRPNNGTTKAKHTDLCR